MACGRRLGEMAFARRLTRDHSGGNPPCTPCARLAARRGIGRWCELLAVHAGSLGLVVAGGLSRRGPIEHCGSRFGSARCRPRRRQQLCGFTARRARRRRPGTGRPAATSVAGSAAVGRGGERPPPAPAPLPSVGARLGQSSPVLARPVGAQASRVAVGPRSERRCARRCACPRRPVHPWARVDLRRNRPRPSSGAPSPRASTRSSSSLQRPRPARTPSSSGIRLDALRVVGDLLLGMLLRRGLGVGRREPVDRPVGSVSGVSGRDGRMARARLRQGWTPGLGVADLALPPAPPRWRVSAIGQPVRAPGRSLHRDVGPSAPPSTPGVSTRSSVAAATSARPNAAGSAGTTARGRPRRRRGPGHSVGGRPSPDLRLLSSGERHDLGALAVGLGLGVAPPRTGEGARGDVAQDVHRCSRAGRVRGRGATRRPPAPRLGPRAPPGGRCPAGRASSQSAGGLRVLGGVRRCSWFVDLSERLGGPVQDHVEVPDGDPQQLRAFLSAALLDQS